MVLLKYIFNGEIFLFLILFRHACPIEFDNKVILTGGLQNSKLSSTYGKATVYNHSGFVEDLPDLNVKRYRHGCGSFIDENNQKAFLFFIFNKHVSLKF